MSQYFYAYLRLKPYSSSRNTDSVALLSDDTKEPLLPNGVSRAHSLPRHTWIQWVFFLISALAAAISFASYSISLSLLPAPRDFRGLRHPSLYPNLDQLDRIAALPNAPKMWFPNAMVMINEASPSETYFNGPQVVLAPQASMIYQWRHMKKSTFTVCYIVAVVPTPEELDLGNKSYTLEGDLGAIEVWNVTTPTEPLSHLNWTNRPTRISLLGTLNFVPEKEQGLEGWQLYKPTPRFECGAGTYTVEIACTSCKLAFLQTRSYPSLGFNLQQLG